MFLALAGIGMGAVASSLTSSAVQWRPVSRFAMTQPVPSEPVDQGQAGRSWARIAYDGGLRRCPEMNPQFVAACQAEMKALEARPALMAGSYGGPLLITKVEPAPEPQLEPYRPEPMPELEMEMVPAAYTPEEPEVTPEPTPDNYPAAPLPN